ncbi:MAG: nucleotide exchange factor GrpE [Steroidobacteraceae bacterium]|nr:nucleotide exchange factor GrpE [Steroidobacteraceae bacterium]MDW8258803.1 nucleotide exchange factor GrpE [Gammaproteobacteria bacterium]
MSGDPVSDVPPDHSAHTDTTTVLPETAQHLVELEQLRLRYAEAEERAKNHWDQYLRAVAELENVRKRAQREVEAANRYGLERFAAELVPVKDSLDLAVENASKSDAAALAAGQEATLRLLTRAFEKMGIVEINPLGQPFDAQLHEAMATQESATAEPGSVLAVVQRGYTLNGRLLRPARVIVAKPPAAVATSPNAA